MADAPSWGGKRGTRHERGYGSRWDKLRLTILSRDGYLCQNCLRQGRPTALRIKPRDHAVDHITPKSQGGNDDPENLESLCSPCHEAKSATEAAVGRGDKPSTEYDDKGMAIWD